MLERFFCQKRHVLDSIRLARLAVITSSSVRMKIGIKKSEQTNKKLQTFQN